MTRALLATLGLLLGALAPAARAHDGPPYPILVDERVGDWTLSVWADPDVGEGTFFYYVDHAAGAAPEELRIRVISEPLDKTSGTVVGESVASEPGEPFQQIGTLPFDHRGLWATRFELHPRDRRDEVLGTLTFELDVTPPGLGAIDILWFAFPFLVVGGLWLRVLLAQRAYDRAHSEESAPRS